MLNGWIWPGMIDKSSSCCFCILQLKNVDFEGLFGNIGAVIDLSQRLLETLQDTDSIGERSHLPPLPPLPPLPLLSFSKGAGWRQEPIRCLLPGGCTLHFIHTSPVNILFTLSHLIGSKTLTAT